MSSPPSRVLPRFLPESVVGRKARPVMLVCNGQSRQAFNIIPKELIVDRSHDFAELVLNPLLHGADVTFVPILNGAINFYVLLSQMVSEGAHVELMPVPASLYGRGQSPGNLVVSRELIVPDKVRNRTLVVLDDVLDTGETAAEVVRLLKQYQPKRVITVFLVRKMHEAPPAILPDYWLFEAHSQSWLYGFGMDIDEKYRHLRFICDDRHDLYDYDGRPRY